jgi:hypothetical protein
VFVSYSRADRSEKLTRLISWIRQLGLEVWFDGEIPPGRSYPTVIAEKLDAAWAVLVVWSPASADSEWVYEEASRGRNRLVPVLFEKCVIPIGFGLLQTASLIDWDYKGDGSGVDPELEKVRVRLHELAANKNIHDLDTEALNERYAKLMARMTLELNSFVSHNHLMVDWAMDPETDDGRELIRSWADELFGISDPSFIHKLSRRSLLRDFFELAMEEGT